MGFKSDAATVMYRFECFDSFDEDCCVMLPQLCDSRFLMKLYVPNEIFCPVKISCNHKMITQAQKPDPRSNGVIKLWCMSVYSNIVRVTTPSVLLNLPALSF